MAHTVGQSAIEKEEKTASGSRNAIFQKMTSESYIYSLHSLICSRGHCMRDK